MSKPLGSVPPATPIVLPPILRPSSWIFKTSDGVDLTVGLPVLNLGVVLSGGELYLQDQGSPNVESIRFLGTGTGCGPQPIPIPGNLSFSLTKFWSTGVVYMGPMAGSRLVRSDFRGPCLFCEISAQGGPGISGTVIFLGAPWAMALPVPTVPPVPGVREAAIAATCRAVVFFAGMTASLVPWSAGGFVATGISL